MAHESFAALARISDHLALLVVQRTLSDIDWQIAEQCQCDRHLLELARTGELAQRPFGQLTAAVHLADLPLRRIIAARRRAESLVD